MRFRAVSALAVVLLAAVVALSAGCSVKHNPFRKYQAMRSSPAPVSTQGAGSSCNLKLPPGS